MKKKELPKLPYGEGSMNYVKDREDLIQYQKRINGKRVVVYGSTSQECMKKMRQKESELEEKEKYHHPTDTNAIALLQDGIYEWLFTFKRPVLKGRSFDTIEGTFNNQIKGTRIGRISILHVTTEDIQSHLNELITLKSESTAKKTFSLLKQFFDYYYARDINNNPMNLVRLPKKQIKYNNVEDIQDEEELIILDDEEIEKLTLELSKPYQPGVIGYTYGHMLLFVMWSFCRIGEVIALQYKDIDFNSHTAKIYKAYGKEKVRDRESDTNYEWVLTTPKTKKGRRVLYLCDQAVFHLQKHIEICCPNLGPNTFLFFSKKGNPMPDQYLNDVLGKALKRAGITKKVSVHGLRHTGISYFLRHGAASEVVSKQAGHNDISTTNGIYYSVIEEQKKDMYKGLL